MAQSCDKPRQHCSALVVLVRVDPGQIHNVKGLWHLLCKHGVEEILVPGRRNAGQSLHLE